MPLTLREFVGFDPMKPKKASPNSSEFSEWLTKYKNVTDLKEAGVSPNTDFVVLIEAIHADIPTRNFTRYIASGCQNSIDSWTQPYNIPVIMYHNDYDGQVIGRVIEASVKPSIKIQGQALVLKASIPNYMDRISIHNGILNTVSIGARANDVRCSICGAQLSEGECCEHERGQVYDGQTCYWDVYEWEAKELSFVIVPSDKYAGVINVISGHDQMPVKTINSSEDHDSNPNIINITESEGENNLDIKEAEKKIGSLQTEIAALKGDKVSLQESVDSLNKDKISMQESMKQLKEQVEEKDLAVSHEKELREAAEGKVDDLMKEVKMSLVESLTTLREKAGKPAIQKLEERSIDSLRDSIADIKAELKESEKEAKSQDLKESKAKDKAPQLNESEENIVKPGKKEEPVFENFDL